MVAIDKPIIKTSSLELTNYDENLILSVDEKGHIFFVSCTRHQNWEQKWQNEKETVQHFLRQALPNHKIPTRGHMQVFGNKFVVNGDKQTTLGQLLLPCDGNNITILPNLIPVTCFASDNTSYVVNGILY